MKLFASFFTRRGPVRPLLTAPASAAAILVLSLLAGCASTGGGGGGAGPGKVNIGSISGLPQVQLPGASMANARSVAMAAARTKGWDIMRADANQLLLERPLPASAPQAQALQSTLAAPRMQVETDIVDRSGGAVVALRAFVLTNPGTDQEKRIDYTKDYESQLLISLSALSSAWLAAGSKINSEVPALAAAPDVDDASPAEGDLGDAAATVGEAELAAPQGAETPVAVQPAPVAAPPAPAPASPAPAPAVAAVPAAGAIAPTIEAPRSPTTAEEAAAGPMAPAPMPEPIAATEPALAAGSNDMLVLNRPSRQGLWSYYAEDYARLRGCAIGDRGAVLLQESNGFEVLEVDCTGAPNVLVKCRGGVCEPMR